LSFRDLQVLTGTESCRGSVQEGQEIATALPEVNLSSTDRAMFNEFSSLSDHGDNLLR
jgi:hypothetical protein